MKYFNLMQNITSVIQSTKESKNLNFSGLLNSYNLTNESLFLDIGSGFGKPVFHCAFQLNCESAGLEVVPARVEFCLDFFYEYLQDKDFFIDIGWQPQCDILKELKDKEFLKRKKFQIKFEENSDHNQEINEKNKEMNDFKTNKNTHEDLIEKSEDNYSDNSIKPKRKRVPLKKKKKIQTSNIEDSSMSNNSENNDDVDKKILNEALYNLKYEYDARWWENIKFCLKDATKLTCYANEKGVHYTHIYSYNKLMNFGCRKKMSKILNNTKFKILSWYSNPKQTYKAGIKNVIFLCRIPMNATSTEKFSVYVYMKIKN